MITSVPLWKKILFGVLIFLFLYTTIGFFVFPPILKSILTKELSKKLHREVVIQQVKFSPFILSIYVKGFVIKDRESSEPFISFDELFVNLQSVSILKRGLIVKEIRINSPSINIIRNEDLLYNFSDLIGKGDSKSSSASRPLRFSLNNIQLLNGSLDFFDVPKDKRHNVRSVTIQVPFLSNLPYYVDTFVQPKFEAMVNDTPFSFQGRTKPFANSRETAFDINIKDFNIPYYLAYIPSKMTFTMSSGYLDTKGCITFAQYKDKQPSLTFEGDITFKKMRVVDGKGSSLITLPRLDISIAPSELVSKNIHLTKVLFRSPEIVLTRDETGKMNIQDLIPEKRVETSATENKKNSTDVSIEADEIRVDSGKCSFSDFYTDKIVRSVLENMDLKVADLTFGKNELTVGEISTQNGTLMVKRSSNETVSAETPVSPSSETEEQTEQTGRRKGKSPLLMRLKTIVVEQYTIKAVDQTPSQPVTVVAERIMLKGKNISTAKNSKGTISLSFTVNKKGSLATNGSIIIDPLSAHLKLDLKGIDIVPLQPYIADKINIMVTNGHISSSGELSLSSLNTGELNISYKGDASFLEFASVDQTYAEDFLTWNSLHASEIAIGYNPSYLNINGIALTDFYSRLIINPDGTLNVQSIVKKNSTEEENQLSHEREEGKNGGKQIDSAQQIKIEQITLQGGTINFSDRYIKPNYSATLLEIGGRVSGLSSEENKFADVDLKGKLENYAPLEITGKINPLREDLYVDLKVDFKDMDISSLTPYSGKYVGYTIQKGKLSLDLQYLIVKRKLDSQNRVLLDQLTLGDKVESPDATKLPVKLAIALLKDRNGEIQLDLPVSGFIDDPEFRLGRIIIKILVNILTKAATSPFALLGAIFGGGEELSYIEFDYGSASLSEQGKKKIDTLIKALYDRPSLNLEVIGYVDVENDREGLRQYLFHKKIKAQKLQEMVKKGSKAIPVDEVTIEPEEYPKYLKKAYKKEKFPKPRNIIGFAKSLPVPEMEKLMLTHTKITDDDLRLLASQRTLKVKEYLLQSKQIEQERIFLVTPESLEPEKKEQLKNSRVDFKLE